MHTATSAFRQQLDANLDQLKRDVERATTRFIVRMALFIVAIDALFFAFHRFS